MNDARRQQERLLNLHLSGSIDEATLATKNFALRDRLAALPLELESTDRCGQETVDHALRVFELSQSMPEKWVSPTTPKKEKYSKWSV
jgi:hypothetical protein